MKWSHRLVVIYLCHVGAPQWQQPSRQHPPVFNSRFRCRLRLPTKTSLTSRPQRHIVRSPASAHRRLPSPPVPQQLACVASGAPATLVRAQQEIYICQASAASRCSSVFDVLLACAGRGAGGGGAGARGSAPLAHASNTICMGFQ